MPRRRRPVDANFAVDDCWPKASLHPMLPQAEIETVRHSQHWWSVLRTVLVVTTLPLGYVVGLMSLRLPVLAGILVVSLALVASHINDRSADLPVILAGTWIVALNGFALLLLG